MRYIVLLTVLAFSVILTKSATDRLCIEESEEEICKSVHIQCGVKIKVEDTCGKREALCACPVNRSCSLETLTCE